jgi:hypothetical protein
MIVAANAGAEVGDAKEVAAAGAIAVFRLGEESTTLRRHLISSSNANRTSFSYLLSEEKGIQY